MKLSSGDVDASNIVRPSVDELSAEGRQPYEASVVLISLLQEPEG